PVENQAHVAAVDACDGVTPATDDSPLVLVTLVHPDFTVTKECVSEPLQPGATADFLVTVTNTGDVRLLFSTDDAAIGPFSLNPAGVFTQTVSVPVPPGVDEVCNDITVTATIPYCELPNELVKSARDCCQVAGLQGCTPGFWKNHPACWACFDPDDLVGDVFNVPGALSALAGDDLMDALNYGGGKGTIGAARNLLRHAVSALLNACNPNLDYPMSVDGVILAVNAALATLNRDEITDVKNMLADYNELGCYINAHCEPSPDPWVERPLQIGEPVESSRGLATPTEFAVTGIVPNPLSGSTAVSFALPTTGRTAVDVYDMLGRKVTALLSQEVPAGYHTVVWNGTDAQGNTVAPGVYFCRIGFAGQEPIMSKLVKLP
ncbi:MAG: FlgD immunoglobulin-like domain containing protein, partial [bacterium]